VPSMSGLVVWLTIRRCVYMSDEETCLCFGSRCVDCYHPVTLCVPPMLHSITVEARKDSPGGNNQDTHT
jgi:hypothetical protein